MDPMVWSFMVLSLVLSFLIPVHPSYHVYKEPGIRLVYGFSHAQRHRGKCLDAPFLSQEGVQTLGRASQGDVSLSSPDALEALSHFQSDQDAADMPPTHPGGQLYRSKKDIPETVECRKDSKSSVRGLFALLPAGPGEDLVRTFLDLSRHQPQNTPRQGYVGHVTPPRARPTPGVVYMASFRYRAEFTSEPTKFRSEPQISVIDVYT